MKHFQKRVKKLVIRIFNRLFKKRKFALNNLDTLLEIYIGYRNGFFIEVGANDGSSQSNTRYFEMYKGWRGLLVEPIPDLYRRCRQNRPKSIVENYALVSSDYSEKTIGIHYCNLMSVIENEAVNFENHLKQGRTYLSPKEKEYFIEVPACTLSWLIEKHKIDRIDLLSLDVEGYESEVLKGLDLHRHRPKYMLIEVRDQKQIESIIGDFYKLFAILHAEDSYSDILYKRRDG